jgi:hypothetical protein
VLPVPTHTLRDKLIRDLAQVLVHTVHLPFFLG